MSRPLAQGAARARHRHWPEPARARPIVGASRDYTARAPPGSSSIHSPGSKVPRRGCSPHAAQLCRQRPSSDIPKFFFVQVQQAWAVADVSGNNNTTPSLLCIKSNVGGAYKPTRAA